MTFRLDPQQLDGQSLSAIVIEQLSKAIESARSHAGDNAAVHQTRQYLKRVRAALRLIHSAAKHEKPWSDVHRVAEIARRLAQSRDAEVLADTVEILREEGQDLRYAALLDETDAWAAARCERIEEAATVNSLDVVADELERLRDELASAEAADIAGKHLLRATAKTYRQGRTAMETALSTESENDVHEWRKHVQRHWRQMELLKGLCRKYANWRIDTAKALSKTLGEHHDLAVLRETILNNRAVFATPSDVRALCCLIAKVQAKRLAEGAEIGEALYSEKPRALRKKMKARLQKIEREAAYA